MTRKQRKAPSKVQTVLKDARLDRPIPVVDGPRNNGTVTGGSYAAFVNRLHHPHGPSLEMVAKGLVTLLETNHFDAAMIVSHTLSDLMDDSCLREREPESVA